MSNHDYYFRREGPHDYFISRWKLGRLRLARRRNIYGCCAEGILELRGYPMNAEIYTFLSKKKNWIKRRSKLLRSDNKLSACQDFQFSDIENI